MATIPEIPEAELRSFLEAIHDDPDDETRRLVFADWLDEHGDPVRAEWIRLGSERREWDTATEARLAAVKGRLRAAWIGSERIDHLAVNLWEGFLTVRVVDRPDDLYDWRPLPPRLARAVREGWARLETRPYPERLPALLDWPDAADFASVDLFCHARRFQEVPRLDGLVALPGLARLELVEHDLPDGLLSLAGLPRLRDLSLVNCESLSDEALVALAGLPALRCLSLAGIRGVRGHFLRHVLRAGSLREVRISSCEHITSVGVASLRGAATLESLSIVGCDQVTGTVLAFLDGLAGLRELELGLENRLDDNHLRALPLMPALRRLALVGCDAVTPACADALRAAMPRLVTMTLSGSWPPVARINEFRAALPGVEVGWVWPG